MSDDYHFHLDPATLIDAKLTKDEAEAFTSYRLAKEQWGDRELNHRNLVVVLPVAAEFLAEVDPAAFEQTIREMAGQAAVDAARREMGRDDPD
jgi:hypothetical protein